MAMNTLLSNDGYPLSPLQEGLLFHSLELAGSGLYVGQISYRIEGDLRVDMVKASFGVLYRRHGVLRTTFDFQNEGHPRQRLRTEGEIEFTFQDLRAEKDWIEKDTQVKRNRRADKYRGFDLSKDVLMRVLVIQLDEYVFELIWSWHHIIMDGWSIGILQNEFIEVYDALCNGRTMQFVDSRPYQDYVKWLSLQDQKDAAVFWANYLDGYTGSIGVPVIKDSMEGGAYIDGQLTIAFEESLSAQLYEIARKNRVTLYYILQCLWGILLCRYNRVNDAVFGTVVSGRPAEIEDIESMVGLFINTIPVRVKYDEQLTFKEMLQVAKEHMTSIEPYQYFQLAEIQANTAAKSRLLNHTLVLENYPLPDFQSIDGSGQAEDLSFKNLIISNVEISEHNHYNFNMTIMPGRKVELLCTFNANVYEAQYIEQIVRNFVHLAKQVVLRDDILIGDLQLQIPRDISDRIAELSGLTYAGTSTLVGRWEESVLLYGERDALNYESRLWSYGALNSKVNQLAHYLRSVCGVGPDDLVGLLLEKSDYTVLGILGILKAGGAYVPVDISHPSERIQYILGDALPKVVITQSDHISRLGDYEGHVFVIDLELDLLETSAEDPDHVSKGSDLACCIYTSGTTGKPKGSLIEHHSLVNLTDGLDRLLALESDRPLRMAAIAPVVFDPFGKQLFLALLKGHSLYIVPDPLKQSIGGVWDYYRRHQIQLTDGTPSFLQLLLNYYDGGVVPLDYWLIGGEVFPARLAHMLRALYKEGGREPVLLNEYGLTECTVDNSCYKVDFSVQAENGNLPIGRPLPHNDIFLLDEELRPVAAGVTGEICISGAGLGRGYLNGVELTEEKFVEVSHLQGLKVFRTGDLGRELLSKEIVCLGRKDRQVKIRGNRVELGEIEQVLLRQDGVKEVYVTDREELNGERCLVAYVVLSGGYTQLDLRSYLEGLLPAYMLPSYWLLLESLPLTINGKVDKSSLPDPLQGGSGVEEYVAPVSDLEKKLCEIWSEVLLRERISIRDNFFDIGGHSLKAVQVVFRLQRELQADINVTTIFRNPTIEKLAPEIESLLQLKDIGKVPDSKELPDWGEVIL